MRGIYGHDVRNCYARMGGAILYCDGAAIPETLYLHRYAPAEPEHAGCRQIELGSSRAYFAFNRVVNNYYHWITQCLFSIWAAIEYDRTPGKVFILPDLPPARRAAVDLVSSRPIEVSTVPARGCFDFPEVTFLNATFMSEGFPALRQFGGTVLRNSKARPGEAKRIYVSRRDSNKRVMRNEAELERVLSAVGFTVVRLTGLSFAEQISLFSGAELIVGPHGAGLTNVLFCSPGTQILELAPSSYVNPCFARIARVLDGVSYAFAIFEAPASPIQQSISWDVDIGQVMLAIDALARSDRQGA